MSQLSINFFIEDISFTLKDKIHLRSWIKQTVVSEGKKLKELNFVFCSDSYLLEINKEFLNHDTLTDIVTFDNSESPDSIRGDIFISVDRVKENAVKFKATERDELHRVIVHGILHLIGFKDKTTAQKALMTSKEDQYLQKRIF